MEKQKNNKKKTGPEVSGPMQIADIIISETKELKFYTQKYKGQTYVHIRVFHKFLNGVAIGEGVSFPVGVFDRFLEAVQKLTELAGKGKE